MNQWKQMSSQLQTLPEELLVQVLGYLPKCDLKSARRTCSQLARTGAEWLFQRVYFAPRKSAIRSFMNITSNPTFAHNVTELIYDGRLFLPDLLTDCESYEEAFDAFTLDEYPEETDNVAEPGEYYLRKYAERDYGSFADCLICYSRLLEQQQGIFENKDDYKALCAGLKNLPNITTVIVLDIFSGFRDWVPLRVDDHSWYHRRSQYEIPMPFPPSSWNPSSQDPDEPSENKWDVRGIRHLIRAVSQHGNHVVQLHLASECSGVPKSMFGMDRDGCDDACRLVRRLVLLSMTLRSSASYSEVERGEQANQLNTVLSEAKDLHCLAISGCHEVNLLKNKVWPHLETLNLGDTRLQADDLETIIQVHKNTLREVSFRNVYILGDEGWADVAVRVGKCLRLRKINILGVHDDLPRESNDITLADEDLKAVARSFMQSITRINLVDDEHQVTIFACPEESEDSKPHSP